MTKRAIVPILVLAAASSFAGVRLVGHNFRPPRTVAITSSDSEDCCPEWSATNFPIPALSARGDHCPADEVPEGSDSSLDPESGKIEIHFYDSAYNADRSFLLDINDPACFQTHASRRAIFFEIAGYLDTFEPGSFEAACKHLRDAIRAGSIKLGEKPFDLRPAQPYVDEVCKR